MEPDYEKPAFDLYREWAIEMMINGDFNWILGAGIWQRDVYMKWGNLEFVNGFGIWKKGLWSKIEDNENEDRDDGLGNLITTARIDYEDEEPAPPAATVVVPNIEDLPSWVPDLSNIGKKPSSLPWMNVHGFEGFCARSKPACLQLAKWEHPDTNKTPRRIWVKAVLLDKIASTNAIHE
jgi:hypothetical protein